MDNSIPDINDDIVIMTSKKHGMIFNLQSTMDQDQFAEYYRLRVKLPAKDYNDFRKKFGKDLINHFEIAYQVLKILDNNPNYEVIDEDDLL